MDVAVIVVNYNTAALTIEAIGSVIERHRGSLDLAIHVVDNASPKGDAVALEQAIAQRGWEHRVTLHASPSNLGFGAGNNLVLQQLGRGHPAPRYVFLLNPDAKLENDAIAILAAFLDKTPMAVAAGAAINSLDGHPVTAAFRFPGILSTFAGALVFGPVTRLLRKWETPLPPSTPTQRVGWVAGAAVMMRLPAVRRAGYFDPTYFLYYEEVDLMRQLTLQGGEVWHVAEARVAHIEGASTGVVGGSVRPKRLPAYWYASWRHYFTKNLGRMGALGVAIAWYAGAAGNAVIEPLRGKRPQAPERFYRDFWRVAVRPLLGLRPLPYD